LDWDAYIENRQKRKDFIFEFPAGFIGKTRRTRGGRRSTPADQDAEGIAKHAIASGPMLSKGAVPRTKQQQLGA